MTEIWKPIKGFEGYYEVSNLGRVKSLRAGIVMRNHNRADGYQKITLKINGKQKSINVHRLVAEAFIPNPNNYGYVNHIDENRSNNCSDNLEWCAAKYNSNCCCKRQIRANKRVSF